MTLRTYWNPMWEWMRIVAQRMASVIGFRVPAANGATVNGTRAAEIRL